MGMKRICSFKIDDFRFLHPPCAGPPVSVSEAPNSWVCSGSIKRMGKVKQDIFGIFSKAKYFYVSYLFHHDFSHFSFLAILIPLITRRWIKMQLMWDLKLSVNNNLTSLGGSYLDGRSFLPSCVALLVNKNPISSNEGIAVIILFGATWMYFISWKTVCSHRPSDWLADWLTAIGGGNKVVKNNTTNFDSTQIWRTSGKSGIILTIGN